MLRDRERLHDPGARRRAVMGHAVALGLIVAATLLFSAPSFRVGEQLPAGHDHALAIGLVRGFAEGMADGDPYPRWVADANNGYGLPALIGYPPLSGFLVAVANLITRDLTRAFTWVILLFNFVSGVGFLILAKRFAPPAIAGLGAALYILMPYHFVVVYHRFAFAEFSATMWLPFVLHFGLRLRSRATLGSALGLSAAFAGVVLSHVVVAEMVVVGIGIPLLLLSKPWRYPRRAGAMTLALAGSGLLAAAYLLPVVLNRDLTHWDAQYRVGRRISYLFAYRGDPFSILLELSFLAQVACYVPMLPMLWRRRTSDARAVVVVALVVTALHLVISDPVWRWLPGMQFLLYPFRFGLLLSLCAPLGLVWAFRRQPTLAALSALACAAAVLTAPIIMQRVVYVDLHHTDLQLWNQEHIPRTVASIRPRRRSLRRAWIGGGEVRVRSWRPQSRRLDVQTDSDRAVLTVATWYYPGWRATVDGRPRPIVTQPDTGLITVPLARGQHHVTLDFGDTRDRVVGKIISVAAAAVFLALLFQLWRRRRDRQKARRVLAAGPRARSPFS